MNGLNSQEVLKLQQEHGPNIISRKKKKSKLAVFLGIIKDPIIIIMLVAAAIAYISGLESQNFTETYVIAALVIINILISFIQEVKSIEKLEALDKMNEGTSIVIRDGIEQTINASQLVVGDIVKLKIGVIARADMEIIEANNLFVDEAFLTGESLLVPKEENSQVYSNSQVKDGQAIARVQAIAMDTKIGEIAKKVDTVSETKSQLELKILQISKVLLVIAITSASIIFVLSILNGLNFKDSLSITISILIATVPEGLATVLTIVLTFMSQKMAQNNALIKKVSLLETLGEVSYVCTDKTGTITQNNMTVSHVKNYLEEDYTTAITKAVCDRENPTAVAISNYMDVQDTHSEAKLIDKIPFNSATKHSINLVSYEGENYLVMLGAPDYLIADVEAKVSEFKHYADLGLRTIAVTYMPTKLNTLEDYSVNDINEFTLISLFGIQDPPKESAISAINLMHSAHINTVMITGDNINTAISIAKQTNIIRSEEDIYMTGEQLKQLDDEQFMAIVKKVRVYARVNPDDKYRIVHALQKHGEIVAMTGDGTNDSIALKQSNVGVAMGINGTDISKESADLILLDDNFATINEAITGGRLIFDNLRKFIRQMLTSNAAQTATIFFALLLGVFVAGDEIILPMTAVLILWINIVSDAIPCLALGLDNGESDLMNRAPINPNEPILTRPAILEIIIRGFSIGLLSFVAFRITLNTVDSEIYARTVAFVILSFGQLFHIFDARSFNTIYKKNPFENKTLLYAVGLSSILNILIIYSPLNIVFGLQAIPITILLSAIIISSTITFGYSLIKLIYLKYTHKI